MVLIIYSPPCLFAAQQAIKRSLDALMDQGALPADDTVTMGECVAQLASPPDYRSAAVNPTQPASRPRRRA
ncbi:hypothetical protein [Methylotetracoccus oryzae]|uniref:hypothetical protein n=1 Tax=Methylotetracoccus oryzae TaxID=1919059 RepID=UPI00111844D7|nr:hypothetical protein [Methylotetracoccus oryzae]